MMLVVLPIWTFFIWTWTCSGSSLTKKWHTFHPDTFFVFVVDSWFPNKCTIYTYIHKRTQRHSNRGHGGNIWQFMSHVKRERKSAIEFRLRMTGSDLENHPYGYGCAIENKTYACVRGYSQFSIKSLIRMQHLNDNNNNNKSIVTASNCNRWFAPMCVRLSVCVWIYICWLQYQHTVI